MERRIFNEKRLEALLEPHGITRDNYFITSFIEMHSNNEADILTVYLIKKNDSFDKMREFEFVGNVTEEQVCDEVLRRLRE